jgi:hypothetical protein
MSPDLNTGAASAKFNSGLFMTSKLSPTASIVTVFPAMIKSPFELQYFFV